MSNSHKQLILLLAARQPQNNGADFGVVPVTLPSDLPVVPGGCSGRSWLRVTVQGLSCPFTHLQTETHLQRFPGFPDLLNAFPGRRPVPWICLMFLHA